jgi:exodeoxyribonuclease VII large subunit
MRVSVSQLNNYIKQVFEAEEMLHNIEVIGEIDGLNVRGNAVFFSLKDKEAVISCSCYYPQKLKDIKNGTQVIVRGSVTYWNKAGKISFNVFSCESFGLGALFQKFEELKKKLESEGLFAAKKPLPETVNRVGVVTSKGGAVIHDIIKVAHRRSPGVDIVLFPAAVQGEGADRQICDGIEYFAKCGTVDVIIVARGGGSKEDLATFNSECIARAVFASSVPVVSAVGHETDWTLIDLVADVRAATPSQAAEMAVREVVTERERIVSLWHQLRLIIKSKSSAQTNRILAVYSILRSTVLAKYKDFKNSLLIDLTIKLDKEFNELVVGEELHIMYNEGIVGAEVKWIKELNVSKHC